MPFIAVGLIVWQLIAGILVESTTVLSANSHYFLNQYMPGSAVVLAMVFRNTVTFLLNLVFPVVLSVAMGTHFSISTFLVLPGLALVLVICFCIGFVIAIVCARFRDVVQIVASGVQVAIFVTPVLWMPELLASKAWILLVVNPFAVLVSIIRDPLLGRDIPVGYWGAAVMMALVGLLLTLLVIGRYRGRLIYWL